MPAGKGVFTTLCRCEGSGWGQVVSLPGKQKEYAITSPCIGSISPHGDLLGKSTQNHKGYKMYTWDYVYRYIDDRNCTFPIACRDMVCPWYLDSIPLYEGKNIVATWSKNPDVLHFTWSDETPNKALIFRRPTREFTLIGDGIIRDYYTRERAHYTPTPGLYACAESQSRAGTQRPLRLCTLTVAPSHVAVLYLRCSRPHCCHAAARIVRADACGSGTKREIVLLSAVADRNVGSDGGVRVQPYPECVAAP